MSSFVDKSLLNIVFFFNEKKIKTGLKNISDKFRVVRKTACGCVDIGWSRIGSYPTKVWVVELFNQVAGFEIDSV